MTAPAAPRPARSARPAGTGAARAPTGVLVWIDAREAVIVRWAEGAASVDRLDSDVPAHRRSTGHVRHDPFCLHGGGVPRSAGEPHRIEHLARFVDDVAARLADDEDVLILGPGTVHERLEARLRELDVSGRRSRVVAARRSRPLTERQLIAELRDHLGAGARRRRVGG